VFELPKTNVNFQFGQYNSINQDKAFQVSQSIPFPTYYSAKSGLYKAELQGSQLQQQATANEIKAQVQYWFYQLQYLQTTKKQLQSLDSLYNDFVNAAACDTKQVKQICWKKPQPKPSGDNFLSCSNKTKQILQRLTIP
jgi:hypothetical protein